MAEGTLVGQVLELLPEAGILKKNSEYFICHLYLISVSNLFNITSSLLFKDFKVNRGLSNCDRRIESDPFNIVHR